MVAKFCASVDSCMIRIFFYSISRECSASSVASVGERLSWVLPALAISHGRDRSYPLLLLVVLLPHGEPRAGHRSLRPLKLGMIRLYCCTVCLWQGTDFAPTTPAPGAVRNAAQKAMAANQLFDFRQGVQVAGARDSNSKFDAEGSLGTRQPTQKVGRTAVVIIVTRCFDCVLVSAQTPFCPHRGNL